MADAMRVAKNGLEWYSNEFPETYSSRDDEAHAQIDAAIESLNAELIARAGGVPSRCPLCSYQHGHAIGCENNPVDIALKGPGQQDGWIMSSITRDDIIRMAREAGFEVHARKQQARVGIDALLGIDSTDKLERFAALIAAAEREAAQRAFWEACRPHGKVGEVIYTTYKHIHAKGAP